MSIMMKKLIYLVVSATVSWGSVGVAIADGPAFYEVRLLSDQQGLAQNADQKNRLTRFVERLRAELMVDNLGEANIGCDRCGELVAAEKVEGIPPLNRPLTSLKFALMHNGSQLEAFARSYDFVQTSELGAVAFKMEIDGTSPPSSACSATQLSWGCKTRQVCYQTGGCDKPYGGSCQLCTE
jgi:hypothetical protein